MTNDLKRAVILRAARQAHRIGVMARSLQCIEVLSSDSEDDDLPRSTSVYATASTGYQLPSACWAPKKRRD